MLTQIDFFQLWMFGILAFGLAAIFKVSLRKALVLSYIVWFLKALANIGIGLIGDELPALTPRQHGSARRLRSARTRPAG
ncbi:MAG: hypothetical protein MZV64_34235 [Ignavibacteriales bacterium]|nr:hypothetical protein [Ignavibacteriales bacterium]